MRLPGRLVEVKGPLASVVLHRTLKSDPRPFKGTEED